MRRFRRRGRAPWAMASFIAIPLFFSALMASTLAQERPRVVQWRGGRDGLLTTWHDPTAANEARVWLWALLPPLVLSAVGWVCTRLPLGWYVACVAAIVEAVAVVNRVDTWAANHAKRFPWGVDLIPATNGASNQWDPGEWETIARETAISLERWTIGLALVAMLAMAAVTVRRRFFSRRRAPAAGVGAHAPDATGASVPVE